MKKLTRFGVSMDPELVKSFDQVSQARGYRNRSQAISDLVRKAIVEYNWENDSEAQVAGTLALIYDHHTTGLDSLLNEIQHDYHSIIVSSVHVHLDHDNCLEVLVVKGKVKLIRELSDRLLTQKGVKNGHLSIIAVD
ncbi:MAG: nickel-responsive transcriptional regulator NikR [Firmicutes bacterium]|nr:nickel-responsive transcriptional regulator NikR [Bacillota bacterium]